MERSDPCPATDIDQTLGRMPQVLAQVLVDHMRSDPPAQRGIVVVHEALRKRSPAIFGGRVRHTPILPDP
jgi:hypothetical protein